MAAPTLIGNEFSDFWNGASYTSAGITWGTTVADLLLIAGISVTANNNTVPTINSVSDSLGLTWTRLGTLNQTGIASGITAGPIAQTLEIWYAKSPGNPSWTGHTITVATSANTDVGIISAARLQAARLADPVDHHASLPATAKRTASGAPATLSVTGVSTATADTCIYAVRASAGAGNNINAGAFTIAGSGDFGAGTLHQNVNFNIEGDQGRSFTSIQSGITVLSNTSIDNSMIIVGAFTSDVQGAPAPTIARATIVG